MLTPKSDPIFVRASVADRCNLDCIYCPKQEGMENRVPPFLAGQKLSVADYLENLNHIARNGIKAISFTGGEPTLNRSLPKLIRHAAEIFERVELTSNAYRLSAMLTELATHLHVLKISLDTMSPKLGQRITSGSRGGITRACECVMQACKLGLTVGINVVVMKSTVDEVDDIVAFCRHINNRGYPGSAYVSLLDFYYSPERRTTWEQEFIPIEVLAERYEARFGRRVIQQRFGCTFYWVSADGVEVKFKDSLSATNRAPKCHGCKFYCQEGIYGLKHSVEGWVTSCPNGEPSLGVYLAPGLSAGEADALLHSLMADIVAACPDPTSFKTLLRTHGLDPRCEIPDCTVLP